MIPEVDINGKDDQKGALNSNLLKLKGIDLLARVILIYLLLSIQII